MTDSVKADPAGQALHSAVVEALLQPNTGADVERLQRASAPQVWYFGCYTTSAGRGNGHHLHGPHGVHANRYELPVALSIDRLDGGYAPAMPEMVAAGAKYQEEGLVKVTHVGLDANAYTVLSFWDRSGDHRPNSVSAFVVHGKYHYHAALALARGVFPDLFARFTFALRPLS